MKRENVLWVLLGINLVLSIASLIDATGKYPSIPLYIWLGLFANLVLIACFWLIKYQKG